MKEIYNKYCFQILSNDQGMRLRYNGGSIATQIQEIEISLAEAQCIMAFDDAMEVSRYVKKACAERMRMAKTIKPSEYEGETIKLIMG